jgi:hypothetical protein
MKFKGKNMPRVNSASELEELRKDILSERDPDKPLKEKSANKILRPKLILEQPVAMAIVKKGLWSLSILKKSAMSR